MKESSYNSYEELPLFLNAKMVAQVLGNEGVGLQSYEELLLFLNAKMVAQVLGIAPSSAYELMHVIVTNSISLVPPQAAGLAHSVAPPLPTQTPYVCAGTPFSFPVLKVGSRMVVPKEKFIQWVEQNTGGGDS